jgi:hypothetical protein
MLISANPRELDFLPCDEAICRVQEDNDHFSDRYRLSDHSELKNLERRAGTRIHHSELILGVQQINPRIFVQRSINYPEIPWKWGFYMDVRGRMKYVSGCPDGWLREFSCYEVDERNLMTGYEIRGWRTILLRMLASGLLAWAEVLKRFGDAEGVNSNRWRMLTLHFREGCSSRMIHHNYE